MILTYKAAASAIEIAIFLNAQIQNIEYPIGHHGVEPKTTVIEKMH